MSKLAASLASIAMALAILMPIEDRWRGEQGDSFPFSWYPMFSRSRPVPESSAYVVGEDGDGTRHIITSRYYARGTMNQARLQLGRLADDPRSAATLCREIAERIATKPGKLEHVERVRIVRGWFDMKEYFGEGKKDPQRERTYARCRVPARQAAEPSPEPEKP